jgi:hypothetical protein
VRDRLALFGENVARQFLSQSLGWADCIIFAMAPLGRASFCIRGFSRLTYDKGILTAIVSAIRVGGPSKYGKSPLLGVC